MNFTIRCYDDDPCGWLARQLGVTVGNCDNKYNSAWLYLPFELSLATKFNFDKAPVRIFFYLLVGTHLTAKLRQN